MRRYESDYRINEGDDVLGKENAIHQDLDLRVDAIELLGQAFAEGNRADIEALIAAYRDTVSGLARQVEDLLGEAQGGISADAIFETADRLFLTAARRAAILSDLRGGVDTSGDTLAKLLGLIAGVVGGAPAGRQSLKAINDAVVANTATLNAITNGSDPTLDSFAEALTRFVVDEGQISGLLTMVGNRLRLDVDGAYSGPQRAMGLANLGLAGVMVPYAGATAPSGWLLCYGQNVLRGTYPKLFAAIGTAHGAGDGSTSFGVPDLRGRSVFGKDDMGGTAASRLTAALSGLAGSTLGAAGGSQSMPGHTHGVTDPGHSHTNAQSFIANGGANNLAMTAGTSWGLSGGNTNGSATGISVQSNGAGASGNVPPAWVGNWIICAGA